MPGIARVYRCGAGTAFTIPIAIVRALNLKSGDRVVVDTDGEQLYAKIIPLDAFLTMRRQSILDAADLGPQRRKGPPAK